MVYGMAVGTKLRMLTACLWVHFPKSSGSYLGVQRISAQKLHGIDSTSQSAVRKRPKRLVQEGGGEEEGVCAHVPTPEDLRCARFKKTKALGKFQLVTTLVVAPGGAIFYNTWYLHGQA